MCVCICMHVCIMYVCVNLCTCVCIMYVCMCACVCMYVCMYVCIHPAESIQCCPSVCIPLIKEASICRRGRASQKLTS
jgi:hypothetical protein